MTHGMSVYGELKTDFATWEEIDKQEIRFSDEVVVLATDGFKDSVGVKAEINYARSIGKPVRIVEIDHEVESEFAQSARNIAEENAQLRQIRNDLQKRNSELVERNRELQRLIDAKGPIKHLLQAYNNACYKHREFPDDIEGQGLILAEEGLEVSAACMSVIQAVNDHRDTGKGVREMWKEIAQVGAVVLRMLESADTCQRQKQITGK